MSRPEAASGAELDRLAAQFDSLLAGAPLGIGIFDRDCRHVRVNAVLAQMNGRTPEELAGRTPAEVNGEVGEQAEVLYRQVMEDGAPMRGVRLSGEVSARPGDLRHWDLTFYPILQPAAQQDLPDGPGPEGVVDGSAEGGRSSDVVGLCVIVDDVTVETELEGQVRAGSARIEQIIESMSVGYLAMDADWCITLVNAQAEAALGRPRSELVGGVIWELFPETSGTAFEAGYRRARDSGQPFSFDAYYPAPLEAWYEVRATPEGEGVALYFTDITARVAAQREAEAAARRAELLAAAGERLSFATEVEEALAVLPQLLVPAVADWAVVTTVDSAARSQVVPRRPSGGGAPTGQTGGREEPMDEGDGTVGEDRRRAALGLSRMRDVAHHHQDPAMRGWLAQYALTRMDSYRSAPAQAVPPSITRALVQGQPSVVPSGAAQALLAGLPTDPSDPAARALRALAPESAVAVPLVSRGRTLGMISLCWDAPAAPSAPAPPAVSADLVGPVADPGTARGEGGASPVEELGVDPVATRTALAATGPTPEVVALVRTVADRAAVIIDSIAAAQRQLEISEELQRSLLTPPPEPDHAHVVVRYVPAAVAAQVGGDWYDAFIQPPGDTVLVIGDVVGHDISAAAAMGQVRTLVRAAAVMTGAGPAQVLASTDMAMLALEVPTTATAVVVRLEQDDEQVARATTTVRWSNAGHPPPLLLTPEGSTRLLSAGDGATDLLLGVAPAVPRADHTAEVDRGSTVLLYTDGLVERRGEGLDVGLARLSRTVRAVCAEQDSGGVEQGLDAFCDEVVARMLPSRPKDDVALVAVRLHPQDRPRPVEAGRRRIPGWVAPEPPVLPGAGAAPQ